MTDIRSQPRVPQIGDSLTRQGPPPDLGHFANFAGGRGEQALQGVFKAAVDDSLRADGLSLSQPAGFQQEDAIAATRQSVEEPQSRGPASEDQDVEVHVELSAGLE